jgi:hypothetical protein
VHSPGHVAVTDEGMTHDQLMTNIELYGRQVIPRARELLG